jgi:GTPase SAR1 family protein
MILFSVDESSTFENACAMRKKIERAKDSDAFPMIFVGNKCDKQKRDITFEQGVERALEMGCPYIETSAKSGVSQFMVHISFVRSLWPLNNSCSLCVAMIWVRLLQTTGERKGGFR